MPSNRHDAVQWARNITGWARRLINAAFDAMTPAPRMIEVPMKSLLTPDEIEMVAHASLSARLVGGSGRALTMQGVDPLLWQSFPTAGNDVDQLRIDLGELAALDVADPPLLRWLANARRRAGSRAEAAIFAEFEGTVAARTGTDSTAPSRRQRKSPRRRQPGEHTASRPRGDRESDAPLERSPRPRGSSPSDGLETRKMGDDTVQGEWGRYRNLEELPPLQREHYEVARSLKGRWVERSEFKRAFMAMYPDRKEGSILPADHVVGHYPKDKELLAKFLQREKRQGRRDRYRFAELPGRATGLTASSATVRSAPGRTTSDGHAVIASWVHLSDIHFGHGGAAHKADQRLILDALKDELRTETPGDVPALDMMLITGDIAFSGAAVSADEYDVALAELTEAAGACGVPLENVYAVPGNHDVNGKATASRRDQKALLGYRKHGEPIDDALTDPDMLAVLRARQAGYLAFTEHLAPACQALYWKTTIDTTDRPIRLVGLNTALLADIRDDQGKLQLGKQQLTETLMRVGQDEIVIVLTHHPLGDRWLRDEKEARNFMRGRAHVHLCGHAHDAETTGVQSGGGQRLVTIAAGATHDEDYPGAGHGFSYGALIRKPGGYAVRIWPRVFSKKQYAFVRDSDGVRDGQQWADHAIQG